MIGHRKESYERPYLGRVTLPTRRCDWDLHMVSDGPSSQHEALRLSSVRHLNMSAECGPCVFSPFFALLCHVFMCRDVASMFMCRASAQALLWRPYNAYGLRAFMKLRLTSSS